MRNKSVAVLDIRSDEICAAIAEKGVNNTFIIKSKYSLPHDGYAEGELLDAGAFTSALHKAVGNIVSSAGNTVKQIFVSVPGEFTEALQTDKVITFLSSVKIAPKHIQSLINVSVPQAEDGWRVVKCGALYFVLSDKRKLIDPVGEVSDSLRAKLSFFACKASFLDIVERALAAFPAIKVINWIPQSYAEAQYLVPREKKNGYTVLVDFGFISSGFNVACGNGVAYSEAFSVGIGHIALLVMEELDIPYDAALALLKQVNLNAKDRDSATEELSYDGKILTFNSAEVRSLIREGLDAVCGMIEMCIQSFALKDLSGAPIYITGEGIGVIRGTIERMSSRLVTPVETIAPAVPYYDKTRYSSLFSLLSVALNSVAQ